MNEKELIEKWTACVPMGFEQIVIPIIKDAVLSERKRIEKIIDKKLVGIDVKRNSCLIKMTTCNEEAEKTLKQMKLCYEMQYELLCELKSKVSE